MAKKKIKADTDHLFLPKRYKFLHMTPENFLFLFKEGMKYKKNFAITQGFPEDAKAVAVVANTTTQGIMILVYSEKYDVVPDGEQPPVEKIVINY